jgi:hypothetical protein
MQLEVFARFPRVYAIIELDRESNERTKAPNAENLS